MLNEDRFREAPFAGTGRSVQSPIIWHLPSPRNSRESDFVTRLEGLIQWPACLARKGHPVRKCCDLC
jgi:hypothetical protein